MRVVVVGSVPPPRGGHRDALLSEVLRLRALGNEVEIVSLDTLAASHRYLAAPGVPAAFEVGFLARCADALVVQLEPGLPVRHGAGRAERAAALVAMSRALRGKDATLRLYDPDDLPGGPGGRAALEIWTAAGRIEVGSESLRQEMAAILGPLGGRVSVMATPGIGPESDREPAIDGWGDGAGVSAADVTSIVRARAAAEREALGRRGLLEVPGGGRTTRVSQWQWLPAPGAGVPDLSRRQRTGDAGNPAVGRSGRQTTIEGPTRGTFSVRRGVMWVLAAAERRPATRPVAHVARLTWTELRRMIRRVA